MSTEDDKPNAPASRFRGGIPHYHRTNKVEENGWDEWTGDRVKRSGLQKKERIIHGVGTIITGCVLLVILLSTVFFFWDTVLSLLGK